MKNLILAISLLLGFQGFCQEDESLKRKKWGASVEIGMNTTSSASSAARPVALQWAVGFHRNFGKKRFHYNLGLKYTSFGESFKDLTYYSLNSSNVLVSEKYRQRNTYGMIHLGFGGMYDFKNDWLFVQGNVGLNYVLVTAQKRLLSAGNAKTKLGVASNFGATRPEFSVGVGYRLKQGNVEWRFSPLYKMNFTFGTLNAVPTFHSIGIETRLNF